MEKEVHTDNLTYIIGDIHGKFGDLRDIIHRVDLRDCKLICVGDLGIGFQHPAKGERSMCVKLNTFFLGRNIQFSSIRGNHDDPAYFNGSKRIELSNFKLLPDYHVEIINGERFLFVGGAISVDRLQREIGRSYWLGEKFNYDDSRAVDCDVLIVHSCPTWLGPSDKAAISGWCDKDKTLWAECVEERKLHDKLISECKCARSYSGHMHISAYTTSPDGVCAARILDEFEITEHR